MPIYDPRNYIAFVKALASTLATLNPKCASVYEEHASRLIERVEELVSTTPRVEADAVADHPFTVYAVEWLGLHVRVLLSPEPGLPATPELIEKARSLLSRGAWAVVTNPPVSQASRLLLSMARSTGAPVVMVPSPLAPKPIPEKLEEVVSSFRAALAQRRPSVSRAEAIPVYARWLMVVVGAALAFGSLSALIAARRMYFLAASLPHSSLLAATLAIPIAYVLGGYVPAWAALIAVAVTLSFYALIEHGVDPDIATSVYVSAAASASVAAMYYVLSTYPVSQDLWAYILGDPLLATSIDAIVAVAVGVATLAYTLLVYRENVCIGVDPEGTRLAGLRVWLYDLASTIVVATAAVLLLRTVGFVVEHVLLLLPGATAATIARGMWRAYAISLASALAAGLAGLTLALILGAAPAATIGGVMVALYAAALLYARGRG
jgi:ABC-type Mn2+/Zn2+ transport system permease subunit